MAGPETPGKDGKGESNKTQAVNKFLVPVTVAWLLAVAGLLNWGMPAAKLLDNAGLLAVVAAGALAFLAVALSGFQDLPTAEFTQWLLFPEQRFAYPSYRAFTPRMLEEAKLSNASFPELKLSDLRYDPRSHSKQALARAKKQDALWFSAYNRHRAHPAVAHFSTRHVAWRDTVPLLLMLANITRAIIVVLIFKVVFWGAEFHGVFWGWLVLYSLTTGMLVLSWYAGRHCNIALVIEVLREISREQKEAEAER